jgi:DNA primase
MNFDFGGLADVGYVAVVASMGTNDYIEKTATSDFQLSYD